MSTNTSRSRRTTFFTDRMAFTMLLLAAYCPPEAMDAEISSLYILYTFSMSPKMCCIWLWNGCPRLEQTLRFCLLYTSPSPRD